MLAVEKKETKQNKFRQTTGQDVIGLFPALLETSPFI